MAPMVKAIQAMRGIAFINAVTLVAEIGDFTRFANPRQLMAYVGLVPSEHSSGASVRRGGVTKAGNGQARRALIEGAWTYRMQARISRKLHDRIEPLPQEIRDIAWKAQVPFCTPVPGRQGQAGGGRKDAAIARNDPIHLGHRTYVSICSRHRDRESNQDRRRRQAHQQIIPQASMVGGRATVESSRS